MRLLFVGDGDLDAAIVPRLVEGRLEVPVQEEFRRWSRLHGGGYRRKVQYAVAQARSLSMEGVVATVDTDCEQKGSRLRRLKEARRQERGCRASFPLALGEATPHVEAWLLDDPQAVRKGLGLPDKTRIPDIRNRRHAPKKVLEELLNHSQARDMDKAELWKEVARHVDLRRCRHARETGLGDFLQDVLDELGPLLNSPHPSGPRSL